MSSQSYGRFASIINRKYSVYIYIYSHFWMFVDDDNLNILSGKSIFFRRILCVSAKLLFSGCLGDRILFDSIPLMEP